MKFGLSVFICSLLLGCAEDYRPHSNLGSTSPTCDSDQTTFLTFAQFGLPLMMSDLNKKIPSTPYNFSFAYNNTPPVYSGVLKFTNVQISKTPFEAKAYSIELDDACDVTFTVGGAGNSFEFNATIEVFVTNDPNDSSCSSTNPVAKPDDGCYSAYTGTITTTASGSTDMKFFPTKAGTNGFILAETSSDWSTVTSKLVDGQKLTDGLFTKFGKTVVKDIENYMQTEIKKIMLSIPTSLFLQCRNNAAGKSVCCGETDSTTDTTCRATWAN